MHKKTVKFGAGPLMVCLWFKSDGRKKKGYKLVEP